MSYNGGYNGGYYDKRRRESFDPRNRDREETNWSPMKLSGELSPMRNGGWTATPMSVAAPAIPANSPMETFSTSPTAPSSDHRNRNDFLHQTQRTPSSIHKGLNVAKNGFGYARRLLNEHSPIAQVTRTISPAKSPVVPATRTLPSGKVIWSKDHLRPRKKALMSSYAFKSTVDYLKKCNPNDFVLCPKYGSWKGGDSQAGMTGTEEDIDEEDLLKTAEREGREEFNASCKLTQMSQDTPAVFAGNIANVVPEESFKNAPKYPNNNSKRRKVSVVITGSESEVIEVLGKMTHPSTSTGYNDDITSWVAIPVSDAIEIGEIGMRISEEHYEAKRRGLAKGYPPPFWYCFVSHSRIAAPTEMTDGVLDPMKD